MVNDRIAKGCGQAYEIPLQLEAHPQQMSLSSVGIENFAALDEVGALPSGRLDSLVEKIVLSQVRKLAISLMFPLLEKYNMPIKLF